MTVENISINFNERILPDSTGIEPVTSSPVGRASDWATDSGWSHGNLVLWEITSNGRMHACTKKKINGRILVWPRLTEAKIWGWHWKLHMVLIFPKVDYSDIHVHMRKAWVFTHRVHSQDWSDRADAQADLSLLCALDRRGYPNNIFLISWQKYMLCVAIRSASPRRF